MVAEPARVAVLDHGQHSSLVIALPGDAMGRYAYGDRRYFALRQTGSTEGIAALLWPTQAVLGRARLQGPLWPDSLRWTVREAFEDILFFEADAGAARRLVARLDGFFDRNAPTLLYTASLDLWFVDHPEPYSALHNSNRMVGRWLVELGCRLEGPALFSIWRRGTES